MQEENGGKSIFTNNSYQELIYEEGDVIYVNNVPFTLRRKNNKWVAQGTASSMTNATHDTLLGNGFSCLYCESPARIQSYNASTGLYKVRFTSEATLIGDFDYYNTGIVLAGRTTDSLVTMYPTFAIIRFYTTRKNIEKLYLALDDELIVNSASVTPKSGAAPTMSNVGTEMFAPVPEDDGLGAYWSGSFIYAVNTGADNPGRYEWHAIVPLAKDNVSTDIYIGTKLTDGTSGSRKTTSKVTLSRGKVYTISLT